MKSRLIISGFEPVDSEYADAVDKGIFGSQTPGQPEPSDAPSDAQAEEKSDRPKTRFLVDHFRAHITALVNLYVEEAEDNDPDWLANLESLPQGALDFALFVDALGGEETTLCAHGRPKTHAEPQMQPETNLARWEAQTKDKK